MSAPAGLGMLTQRHRLTARLIVALVAVAPMAAGCPKDAPQPPAAGTEEGKLTSPRLVRRIEAQFPAQAKRAGIRKAEVHVQFRIGTDGRPRDLNVVECSHIDVGFEGASMRAVKRWRYLPALADGSPVEVYQIVTIDFALPADEAQSGD